MPAFGKLVEKAFYLGVGLAAYASERGGETLNQMRSQIEKLAEEMEAKGQMTTEEARRFCGGDDPTGSAVSGYSTGLR